MIIAFTGYKRSGKSIASNHLKKLGFERVNFKDSLVEELKKYFPDLLAYWAKKYDMSVDDVLEKKPCDEVRFLMQNWGTDFRRVEDKDYWAKKWRAKVGEKDVVVDDCRFLNEAQAVKDNDGIIIRVIRPGFNGDNHASETEQNLIKVDYTIFNDGKIDKLIQQIDDIYQEIKNR